MSDVWYAAYAPLLPEWAHVQHCGAETQLLTLPHVLYFAGDFPQWGGAVAFIDHASGGGSCLSTAVRLRARENDVVLRRLGIHNAGADLLRPGDVWQGGCGVYDTVVCVSIEAGAPVVTHTAAWRRDEVESESPSLGYLRSMYDHLGSGDTRAFASYVCRRPGAGEWNAGDLDVLLSVR